jgi:alkylhydroperoxidase family enzyme
MEQLPPLNIFRMLSGTGASFAPFMQFISAYLNEGVLDPELRELVILRVGHLCGSNYEVHQHERVARTLGVSETSISAVKGTLPSTTFNDTQNTVLHFADEQVANVKVSDNTFAATKTCLSDAQMIELTLIVGTYIMVCRFLETMEVELEETDIDGSGLKEIAHSVQRLAPAGTGKLT